MSPGIKQRLVVFTLGSFEIELHKSSLNVGIRSLGHLGCLRHLFLVSRDKSQIVAGFRELQSKTLTYTFTCSSHKCPVALATIRRVQSLFQGFLSILT
jgi:hypothetical protein